LVFSRAGGVVSKLFAGREANREDRSRSGARGGSLVASGPEDVRPTRGAPVPSRAALVFVWMIAFMGLGAGAALSFESLCARLTQKPVPGRELAPLGPPEASTDSLALRSAEQRMEQGDWRGAVRLIDTISPEEPSYPLARELRAQAERRLGSGEAAE
jgi:hypothetical protein